MFIIHLMLIIHSITIKSCQMKTRQMEKRKYTVFFISKVIPTTVNTFIRLWDKMDNAFHGKIFAVAYGTMIVSRNAPLHPKQLDDPECFSVLQKIHPQFCLTAAMTEEVILRRVCPGCLFSFNDILISQYRLYYSNTCARDELYSSYTTVIRAWISILTHLLQ